MFQIAGSDDDDDDDDDMSKQCVSVSRVSKIESFGALSETNKTYWVKCFLPYR
jgi:hypothetical protein